MGGSGLYNKSVLSAFVEVGPRGWQDQGSDRPADGG